MIINCSLDVSVPFLRNLELKPKKKENLHCSCRLQFVVKVANFWICWGRNKNQIRLDGLFDQKSIIN